MFFPSMAVCERRQIQMTVRRIKRGLVRSRSTLFHQRSSLLADLFKRHVEATKLLRA
jgi:hypothetical protein